MKKITFLMALVLIISTLNAQEMNQGQKTFKSEPVAIASGNLFNDNSHRGIQEDMLYMNWDPDTETWSNLGPLWGIQNQWGWVCGMNGYLDKAKVERFNLSQGGVIKGVWILPHTSGLNSRSVTLKIYGNDGEIPGSALYSQQVLISSLQSEYTQTITLNEPFSFSAGTYYVGFEFDYTTPRDSFALYCQDQDYAVVNTAYENYNGTWYAMSDSWGTGDDYWNLFIGLVVEGGTSVPQNNANNVTISQRDGLVSVQVSENSAVRVLDITGRVFGNYNADVNSTLNIEQPAGLYLFEIRSSSGVSTQKVLVR